MTVKLTRLWALPLAACLLSASAFGAATIVIVNANAAGEGFNDPTPVAPVGGNVGVTKGQQALNAFNFAAAQWGKTIDSPFPIYIYAQFKPLTCTSNSATLGSAGTNYIQPLYLSGIDQVVGNLVTGNFIYIGTVSP